MRMKEEKQRGKEGGRKREMSRLPCFAWRMEQEGRLTAGSVRSSGSR